MGCGVLEDFGGAKVVKKSELDDDDSFDFGVMGC